MTENLAWIVLLLPLASAVVITLFTQRAKSISGLISIGAVAASFVCSLVLFLSLREAASAESTPWNWLSVGWPGGEQLKIDIGLRLDALSLLMLLVVTGVGGLIHVYSYGYMHDDPGFARFFACLSLFTFSMLGIVLANNFVMMFIFWELVGVSSYLLIGFWYERPAAGDAAKKAFITNRLGDFGFLLGILMLWVATNGLVNFDALQSRLTKSPEILGPWVNVIGLLIFCGAVGKSAQFPLHVWLPDAMEGPTPVSALIHAATMVAAGVYMLCRVFFIFGTSTVWPDALSFMSGWTALDVIAWIGGFTALLAALIAVQQNDIKRILAYSTLSQLGYMVMSVGLAGPTPAMFHLATHAFFKALLFLGAGSVIHAMHHEQDIWRMGALRDKLPKTWNTFLIGTLALAGIWPLAGFYSKDSILAQALHAGMEQHRTSGFLLFGLGVFVALLTSFYMFRLLFVVFFGPARSEGAAHAHESPPVMTGPLIVLAVFALIGGFIGIDVFVGKMFTPGEAHHGGWIESLLQPFGHNLLAAMFGILAALVGISLAATCYWNATKDPLAVHLGWLSRAMRNRFYFDEVYAWLISMTHEALSKLADWFDRWIIAGLGVRGTHGSTEILGRALRMVQTGNLQTYAFFFALGVAVVLFFVLK
jgi:NADH-quinone oxidoreductase subunit L